MDKIKILVVDDNPKYLADALPMYGYDVTVANDGLEALKILDQKEGAFDLILLDVMMPNMDGWDTLKAIRSNKKIKYIPVIMITAVSEDQKVVSGLRIGADDYITKPFSLMVLRARVSVQLRNKEAAAKNSMELDGFEFYFDKMEFFKDGEPIELSKTEQKLLRELCENRGKVLKREYLIDEVWQGDTEFVDAHALTVAIKRLRDKLEDDTQKPEYIKTVYGIGYTWAVNG